MKDDTLDIVNVNAEPAGRKKNNFLTITGKAGNGLLAMRNSMPVEEYLEKINTPFV